MDECYTTPTAALSICPVPQKLQMSLLIGTRTDITASNQTLALPARCSDISMAFSLYGHFPLKLVLPGLMFKQQSYGSLAYRFQLFLG